MSGGGTNNAYRLRRMARLKPDVLERYERGEFSPTWGFRRPTITWPRPSDWRIFASEIVIDRLLAAPPARRTTDVPHLRHFLVLSH
jgi:hypothetical protein